MSKNRAERIMQQLRTIFLEGKQFQIVIIDSAKKFQHRKEKISIQLFRYSYCVHTGGNCCRLMMNAHKLQGTKRNKIKLQLKKHFSNLLC